MKFKVTIEFKNVPAAIIEVNAICAALAKAYAISDARMMGWTEQVKKITAVAVSDFSDIRMDTEDMHDIRMDSPDMFKGGQNFTNRF